MDIEKLKQFCAIRDIRSFVKEPMSLGNRTVATDGRIMIVINQWFDFQDCHQRVKDTLKCLESFDRHSPLRVPEIDHSKHFEKCGVCKDGFLDECPECEGAGRLMFYNEYSDYEVYCATCEGEDFYAPCSECDEGIKGFLSFRLEAFQLHYSAGLFRKITKAFPDCTISLPTSNDTPLSSALKFSFSAGDAYLMPLRNPKKEWAEFAIDVEVSTDAKETASV